LQGFCVSGTLFISLPVLHPITSFYLNLAFEK
jgi:hypothetical protein